jgi:hypothetical protein
MDEGHGKENQEKNLWLQGKIGTGEHHHSQQQFMVRFTTGHVLFCEVRGKRSTQIHVHISFIVYIQVL